MAISSLGSLQLRQLGFSASVPRALDASIVENFKNLVLYQSARLFDKRVQLAEWHPTRHNTLIVCSKGGVVVFWRPDDPGSAGEMVCSGGRCVATQMMLDPTDETQLYMTGGDGCLQVHDLVRQSRQVLLDTRDFNEWYTSVVYSDELSTIVAGTTKGFAHFLDKKTGAPIVTHRLHKDKITQMAIHPRDSNLFITVGNDRFIRLFDLRMLKEETASDPTHLYTPVSQYTLASIPNSAFFSPRTGHKLLVTLQRVGCAVYEFERPLDEPVYVSAETQFFQHMTPIKAEWHPLSDDIFICGKYRSASGNTSINKGIDLFDANSGERLAELLPPNTTSLASVPRVCPVNKFSPDGEILASGSGHSIYAWRTRDAVNAIRGKEFKEAERAAQKKAATNKKRKSGADSDGDDDRSNGGTDDEEDDDEGGPKAKKAKSSRVIGPNFFDVDTSVQKKPKPGPGPSGGSSGRGVVASPFF